MTQSNDTFAAGEVLECVEGTVILSGLVKGACYRCEAFETAGGPSRFSSDRVRINGNWWWADRFRRTTPHDPPGFAEEPESDAAHWVTTVGGERLVGGKVTTDEITTLRAVLRGLLDHVESITCQHETTHRGGSIWTICDDCGSRWADDWGGFQPYQHPPAVVAALAALSPTPEPAREGGK